MGSACSGTSGPQATAPGATVSPEPIVTSPSAAKYATNDPLRLPDAVEESPSVKTRRLSYSSPGGGTGGAGERQAITQNVIQMFNSLKSDTSNTISIKFFYDILGRMGLHNDDIRLQGMYELLDKIDSDRITLEQYAEAISGCATLIDSAIDGDLRVPDFEGLCDIIKKVYEIVEPNKGGKNADYIPSLARVNPEQFAISFCSIDGQRFNIGNSDTPFCIQSCCKPINYLIGLNEFGPEYVHDAIGKEPSGVKFNQMVLKDRDQKPSIPHNPMINAGAIMAVSMVYPKIESRKERLEKVLNIWKRLSGGNTAPIGYDEETYVSESESADRNWCLAYMMKESHSFPECFTSLKETLELYFQTCSLTSTCDAMGIMSATLANGGFCPLTGDQVFTPEQVRSVLPLMLTCGMYDYSGQWAYDVGIPAKSGVGGCVYMVIPNVGGISIWSPRLDAVGNSTRGVHAATELVKYLAVHNFEVFSGLSITKMDITVPKYVSALNAATKVMTAAAYGDAAELMGMYNSGTHLFVSDYDGRTAMHLAASEGQHEALQFLINKANKDQTKISAKDRWNGTPLGDALRGEQKNPDMHSYAECVKALKAAGAVQDDRGFLNTIETPVNESAEAGKVLSAAAAGDLKTLLHVSSQGGNLFSLDYDSRTSFHLAASNGHVETIRYLIGQMDHSPPVQQAVSMSASVMDLSQLENEEKVAKLNAKMSILNSFDRFYGTPKMDAQREGHTDCLKLLEEKHQEIKAEILELGGQPISPGPGAPLTSSNPMTGFRS